MYIYTYIQTHIYIYIYIYIYRSHLGSSFALSSIDIPIFECNLLTTAMPPKSFPQLAKQDNATDSEKSELKLSTLAMAVLAAGSVRAFMTLTGAKPRRTLRRES